MFEHFWPKIEIVWQHRDKHNSKDRTARHSTRQTGVDRDNEFRCWNCGEYIDIYSELCPNCGHSPDPAVEDFAKKTEQ